MVTLILGPIYPYIPLYTLIYPSMAVYEDPLNMPRNRDPPAAVESQVEPFSQSHSVKAGKNYGPLL